MRSITILAGIVLVLLLGNSEANACSCAGRLPVCEAYGTAEAVFVGTVIGVTENRRSSNPDVGSWGPVGYKFSVEQSYSGVSGTQVEVFTGSGFGDCGYSFQAGERYIVYADRDKDRLTTSICMRTKLFEKAGEDVAFLGTLSSRAAGVTINGEVWTSSAEGKFNYSDASITVESDTERREVRPDAQGDFRVSGLKPGKILITLKLPEKFTTSHFEREITVSDRGCANVVFSVNDNGRISGRVVNAEGEPVPGIQVKLENSSDDEPSLEHYEPADEQGKFLFAGVPRGRYLLSVNRARHPNPNYPTNAYEPAFYPGVSDEKEARVIVLGPGEELTDLEVRVARRPASIIEGSVVWPDGSPAKKAQLIIKDVTSGNAVTGGMDADDLGRFKINGYVGQKLTIEAEIHRADVPEADRPNSLEAAGQVTITLVRMREPVKIVIKKLR